jgi:homogentisate 1,2-dioxygenase
MLVAENSMAFMFETAYQLKLSDYAVNEDNVDNDYWHCWQKLTKLFKA